MWRPPRSKSMISTVAIREKTNPMGWKKIVQSIISSMITVAILLPVDNRGYFASSTILDNRLVLTSNRTKLLDYR